MAGDHTPYCVIRTPHRLQPHAVPLIPATLFILTVPTNAIVGVAYIHKGEKLRTVPASLDVLAECEVEYETVPGWYVAECQISTRVATEDPSTGFMQYLQLSRCEWHSKTLVHHRWRW